MIYKLDSFIISIDQLLESLRCVPWILSLSPGNVGWRNAYSAHLPKDQERGKYCNLQFVENQKTLT